MSSMRFSTQLDTSFQAKPRPFKDSRVTADSLTGINSAKVEWIFVVIGTAYTGHRFRRFKHDESGGHAKGPFYLSIVHDKYRWELLAQEGELVPKCRLACSVLLQLYRKMKNFPTRLSRTFSLILYEYMEPPFRIRPRHSGISYIHWQETGHFYILDWRLMRANNTNLMAFSPRANYTDRAATACRRSWCQVLRVKDVAWSAQRIRTAVNLYFLDLTSVMTTSNSWNRLRIWCV
jgi:hypothetical protein